MTYKLEEQKKKKKNNERKKKITRGCACAAPAVRPAELRHGSLCVARATTLLFLGHR